MPEEGFSSSNVLKFYTYWFLPIVLQLEQHSGTISVEGQRLPLVPQWVSESMAKLWRLILVRWLATGTFERFPIYFAVEAHPLLPYPLRIC